MSQNITAPCPQSHSDSDFFGSFRHRCQHHIHHHNATDNQRNAGQRIQNQRHQIGQRFGNLLDAFGGDDAEIFGFARLQAAHGAHGETDQVFDFFVGDAGFGLGFGQQRNRARTRAENFCKRAERELHETVLRRAEQRAAFGGHADHFVRVALRSVELRHVHPQRTPPGEESLRERLIDHADALLARHETLHQQGIIQELSVDLLERIWARIDLGVALRAEQHLSLFAEALAMIIGLNSAYWQAQLLAGLAPRIPESIMPAALSFARSLPAAECAQALLAFLPRLAPAELPNLIDEIADRARVTASESQRAAVLTQLVTAIPVTVPADVLEQAVEAARVYPGYDVGASYLIQLVPYLPLEQRDAVWHEALEAALAIDEEEWRWQPVVTLCAGMPETLLSKALRSAETFESTHYRGQVLATLVPRLSGDLLREAAVLAGACDDRDEQIRLLARLSEALAALGEYGTAMRVIIPHRETLWGSTAFAEISAQMPPALRPVANDPLSRSDHPWQYLHEIIMLLPSVAVSQREGLLSQAMAALADIEDHWQTLALARLAPFLSAAQLRAALAHVDTIAVPPFHDEALDLLVPALVRCGLTEQAAAIVRPQASVP